MQMPNLARESDITRPFSPSEKLFPANERMAGDD
jgi:hypothetical protein